MGVITFVASVFVLVISIIISVLISQPFTGALVRLRANYLPKAVSLDNVLEDGSSGGQSSGVRGVTPRAISGYFLRERQSTAKIGPVITGIFVMLQRTKKLEGWPGVYKGFAPVICQLFLLGFLTYFLYQGVTGPGGGQYRAAPSGPGQFNFWRNLFYMILSSIVALPLNVITNRAIVHPRVLTFRNPRKALEELLSYSEYAQPWRLYQTPGLLATVLAHITWIGMLTRIVRHLTVPALGGLPPSTPADRNDDNYTGHANGSMEVTTLGLAVFLTWCVLSVIVLSPLECVTVRLSVQRPERQQPLHLAYARATARGTAAAAGPAPYNNQAQVLSNSNPGAQESAYQDAVPAKEANNQPSEAAARPSFAITDDDDDDLDVDGRTKQADQQKESLLGGVKGGDDETDSAAAPKTTATPAPAPATAASGPPPRVLGGGPPPSHMAPPPANFPYSADTNQPSEPVIALRPCDEPQSAEEAARAEEQGFGAPTVERYTGMIDCLNKLVDEEGIEALYRGSWVTLLGVLVGNFS